MTPDELRRRAQSEPSGAKHLLERVASQLERHEEDLAKAAAEIERLNEQNERRCETIARLIGDIERLTKERDDWHNCVKAIFEDSGIECRPTCDSIAHAEDCPVISVVNAQKEMTQQVTSLRSQLQGAMKDAERYRWLRLNYWREILGWCFGRYRIKPEKDAKLLDYHIDRSAALSASAEK